jgi:hypothetical protein
MSKRMVLSAVLVLIALVLCAAPIFATLVPFTLTYYSDSTHTVQVGICHYNSCQQWQGSGNMTCTGSTSDYFVYSNYLNCNGPVK